MLSFNGYCCPRSSPKLIRQIEWIPNSGFRYGRLLCSTRVIVIDTELSCNFTVSCTVWSHTCQDLHYSLARVVVSVRPLPWRMKPFCHVERTQRLARPKRLPISTQQVLYRHRPWWTLSRYAGWPRLQIWGQSVDREDTIRQSNRLRPANLRQQSMLLCTHVHYRSGWYVLEWEPSLLWWCEFS